MIKDILLHVSRSYTTASATNNVYVAGAGIYGTFDADTLQYTTYELVKNTTWKDIAHSTNTGTIVGVAVKNDGTLWRWGTANTTNPMNINGAFALNTATQWGTETSWSKVFGGYNSFFSIKSDGTLWGWGGNANYSLGDGTATRRSSPIQIGNASGWSQISSDLFGGLGVKTDGTLWGWGTDYWGQLGTGTSSLNLLKVFSDKQWKKVSAGDSYTLAIDSNNNLWGWGQNGAGKLGDNSQTARTSPVLVGSGSAWTDVATNRSSTMGIKSGGTLWGWGSAAGFRIGTGTTTNRSAPFQVGTATDWKQTTIGHDHGHAIKTTGTLWSWGQNAFGQLGLNDTTQRSSPIQVGTDTNWVKVQSGLSFSIALKSDNTLWGWGLGSSGQMGDGTTNTYSSPIQIGDVFNPDWKDFSVGDAHVLAIKTDGTVWGWGNNSNYELGDSGVTANRSSPIQLSSISDAVVVSAGKASTSVAINSSNQLWVWGYTSKYHFPQQNPNTVFVVSTVLWDSTLALPITSVVSASLGTATNQGWYIGNDGYLYTIPGASLANVGTGTEPANAIIRSVPVQIGTDTNWKSVKTVQNQSNGQPIQTVGIKTDGTLWSWGINPIFTAFNNNGSSTSPIQIGTGSNWSNFTLFSTDYATAGFIGITTGSTMYGIGSNINGALGVNDSNVNITTFTQIGTESTWVSASAFFNDNNSNTKPYVYAIKSNGTLWGWGGDSGFYQLDSTISTNKSSPIQLDTRKSWKESFSKIGQTGTYNGNGFLLSDGRLLVKTRDHTNAGFSTNAYIVPALQTALTGIKGMKSISSGPFNVLFIKADNTLWGWGANGEGAGAGSSILNAMGNNTDSFGYMSPVQLGSDAVWSKVSVGGASNSSAGTQYDFVLSIKTNGTLWAWGYNGNSQLGDGTINDRKSPIQIGSATDWTDIFAGTNNSFAKNSSGIWYGWGTNSGGQLGLGDQFNRSLPVQILDTNFTKVSISQTHGLGVKSNGTLWGWGSNANGEVGDGSLINTSSPIQVGSATNWKDVFATGDSISYAIKTDGTLWTWGKHTLTSSPLQYDTTRWTPSSYGLIPAVSQIDASENSTSTLTSALQGVRLQLIGTDGVLWGWGANAIGDNTINTYSFPQQVGADTNWKRVSSGLAHSMAIKTDGTLWGWGQNTSGQLGNGNTTNVYSPVQIGTDTDWDIVSCHGANHTLALKSNGTLYAAGLNATGQLGRNNTTNLSVMTQIGSATWTKIATGGTHSFAIKTDGTLWAWGENTSGKLGLNDTNARSSPVQVNAGKSYVMVTTTTNHTMAIDTTDKLWAWGLNTTNGQLGDNSTVTKSSPVQIGSDSWKTVAVGRQHTIGIKTNGTLWAWGRNSEYQLGDGTNTSKSSPIQIGSDTDWNIVSAGGAKSFAVKSNGALYGAGTTIPATPLPGAFDPVSKPVQVTSTNWSSIQNKTMIGQSVCPVVAIKSDGTLWGWGFNGYNALLSSTGANQSPVQVSSTTNWKSAEANSFGIIAVTEDIF